MNDSLSLCDKAGGCENSNATWLNLSVINNTRQQHPFHRVQWQKFCSMDIAICRHLYSSSVVTRNRDDVRAERVLA